MNDSSNAFHRLRSRLQGIAYGMLGSVAEAEEVAQDVWLRWNAAEKHTLESAEAWLVAVTTRLSIDRLRSAKVQRAQYEGMWLPEPLLTDSPATPEQILERADEVSLALLVLLERLSPEARAAFVLREVFDAEYAELAQMVGKTEAACRQLVRRAKAQIRADRPRNQVPREVHVRLMRTFSQAMSNGDFAALKSLLAEDSELVGDGGGKVPSFPKPLVGGQRIAQLFFAASRRHGADLRIELANLNGECGLLRFIEGTLESAQAYETDGERIVRIRVQRNPDKLARLAAAFAVPAAPASSPAPTP